MNVILFFIDQSNNVFVCPGVHNYDEEEKCVLNYCYNVWYNGDCNTNVHDCNISWSVNRKKLSRFSNNIDCHIFNQLDLHAVVLVKSKTHLTFLVKRFNIQLNKSSL